LEKSVGIRKLVGTTWFIARCCYELSKRSSRRLAAQILRQTVQFLHITVLQERLDQENIRLGLFASACRHNKRWASAQRELSRMLSLTVEPDKLAQPFQLQLL
jgi:hypothetical protein